ncbi:hypothetical protein HII36_17715 [Nonomuraea sp. NN258]|nr:hypothetical protein [Nonomuraea antri]NRQ33674.1 hypothetical protein [Nonomuraea antri]
MDYLSQVATILPAVAGISLLAYAVIFLSRGGAGAPGRVRRGSRRSSC